MDDLMHGGGFGTRILSWATGSIIGAAISFAIIAGLCIAVLGYAMQDTRKAMETTASASIVSGEYFGAGLGLFPTFVKSAAVGLSGMMGIAETQQDKSGIFTEKSGTAPKPR